MLTTTLFHWRRLTYLDSKKRSAEIMRQAVQKQFEVGAGASWILLDAGNEVSRARRAFFKRASI